MKRRNILFPPAGSTLLGLLLGLPLALAASMGGCTAAVAQTPDQPEAPFTEAELEPIEAEIEDSLPPAQEGPRDYFRIWSENEYDVFESDDFVINNDYETDIYDEQPGPADGSYTDGAEDADIDNNSLNSSPPEDEMTP